MPSKPKPSTYDAPDSSSQRSLRLSDLRSGRKNKYGGNFVTNKKPHPRKDEALIICRRSPNLPHTYACSTIGPTRLNFRVRDGNGCDPRGKLTGKLLKSRSRDLPQLNRLGLDVCFFTAYFPKDITTKLVLNDSRTVDFLTAQSKFYGQAERAISTGKLHALLRFNLQPINLVVFQGPSFPFWVGRSHLRACFPLICIQRLSQPNFATQPCPWQDNWNTRGSSIPVLSY